MLAAAANWARLRACSTHLKLFLSLLEGDLSRCTASSASSSSSQARTARVIRARPRPTLVTF